MAGYGSYPGNGSYLESAQKKMGFGTVAPGVLTPSHSPDGYGEYLSDTVSMGQAADRMAQDVANSRVALSEAMKFEREIADYEDYMDRRGDRQEAARMNMEDARNRFALSNAQHAIAMDEQDEKARINKEMRLQRELAAQKPVYLLLTELYNDGKVSPEAIQEYNEANPNSPLSDFSQDPDTGELYGIAADGQTIVPFEGQGILDAWAQYHPDGKNWALSAMPPEVRERKKAIWEMQRKANEDARRAQREEEQRATEDRNKMIDMLKQYSEMSRRDAEDLRKRIADGAYSSEEERITLEKSYSDMIERNRKAMNAFGEIMGFSPMAQTPGNQRRMDEAEKAVADGGITIDGNGEGSPIDWKQDKNEAQPSQ